MKIGKNQKEKRFVMNQMIYSMNLKKRVPIYLINMNLKNLMKK